MYRSETILESVPYTSIFHNFRFLVILNFLNYIECNLYINLIFLSFIKVHSYYIHVF